MTSIHKIQTKHLNEHSTLYGGQLLEWIDNYCLAKTEEYRTRVGEKFVTRAMNCEFISPAYLGDLITMNVIDKKIGSTSITFHYQVMAREKIVAEGKTTFVKLYEGKKDTIIKEK